MDELELNMSEVTIPIDVFHIAMGAFQELGRLPENRAAREMARIQLETLRGFDPFEIEKYRREHTDEDGNFIPPPPHNDDMYKRGEHPERFVGEH